MINDILNQISVKALELIQDEFNNSSDPFGNPWEPIQVKTHPILIDTTNLKTSFRAYPITDNSVLVENETEYASYHQFGTSKIAQRQILPIETLPEKWTEAFTEIIEENLREEFKK